MAVLLPSAHEDPNRGRFCRRYIRRFGVIKDYTHGMPLIVIMGESGTGKSTVCNCLVEHYGLASAPTYTTRAKRSDGETGHTFISESDYYSLSSKVAVSEFAGNLYCLTQDQADKYGTVTLDPTGLRSFLGNYKGHRRIFVVCLTASKGTRVARMTQRGEDRKAVLARIGHDDKAFGGAKMLADLVIDTEDKSPMDITTAIIECIGNI